MNLIIVLLLNVFNSITLISNKWSSLYCHVIRLFYHRLVFRFMIKTWTNLFTGLFADVGVEFRIELLFCRTETSFTLISAGVVLGRWSCCECSINFIGAWSRYLFQSLFCYLVETKTFSWWFEINTFLQVNSLCKRIRFYISNICSIICSTLNQ